MARKMAVRCKHDGIISAITTISDRPTGRAPRRVRRTAGAVVAPDRPVGKRIDVIIPAARSTPRPWVDLTDPAVLARLTQGPVDTVANARSWRTATAGTSHRRRRPHLGRSISVTDGSRLQAFWTALFSAAAAPRRPLRQRLTQYPVPDAAAPTGSVPGARR